MESEARSTGLLLRCVLEVRSGKSEPVTTGTIDGIKAVVGETWAIMSFRVNDSG